MVKHLLKLAAAAAFVLSAFYLNAEVVNDGDFKYSLLPDRADGMYKKGEKCSFKLTIENKKGEAVGDIAFSAVLSEDGCVPTEKRTDSTAKSGSAVIEGSLDKSGILRCTATFKKPTDGKSKTLVAGAAFDPLEIKPSAPVPEDFASYWQTQKKILSEIPMNVKLTPVSKPDAEGLEIYDVQADTFDGKLSGYLAFPKGAKPKSLPAILTCHGAGVGSSQTANPIYWAKNGFIALDFNAHGLPNGKPKEFYENLRTGELSMYPNKNTDNRNKVFFRTLYMRLMRAIDVLCSQPQWDGKHLVVTGGSQGGGQTLAAAALDRRVTFAVAHIPAMCDHTGNKIGRIVGWPRVSPLDKDGNYDKKKTEESRYWDGMNMAAFIKCPTVITVGLRDTVCPPTTAYATYANLKCQKTIIPMPDTTHTVTAKARQATNKMILDSVK